MILAIGNDTAMMAAATAIATSMRASIFLFILFIGGVLISCQAVKNVASHIPIPSMPKMKLPRIKDVAKLIPGMPDSDEVDAEDPLVPFNARNPLAVGHTLRLEVYEGSRDPSRVFRGLAVVAADGTVALGSSGTARVGGKHLPLAVEAIAGVFRVAGQTSRPVTVHLISVENTPVVGINGDVIAPEYIPAWEDMTVKQAITVSGGRKLKSSAHGVYVIRQGAKRFFTTIESAEEDWSLRAGDIISLSPDI
jgi:hypothetical protein